MKGIILAGGAGTRLLPTTHVISKQLIPVYDKPLIYYPLSTLMLSGVQEILIITTPNQASNFKKLLGTGADLGIVLNYEVQEKPSGIAQSLLIGKDFLSRNKCALILGDNIFHGPGLGRYLAKFNKVDGASIFGYKVKDPQAYGIATLRDNSDEIERLDEKPLSPTSNIAIPGLYFFDENVSEIAEKVKPSSRGELEIIDVLRSYLDRGNLHLEMLPRGTAWFDSGTFNDLHDASSYVKLMQDRTGERVGDPKDVARAQGWNL